MLLGVWLLVKSPRMLWLGQQDVRDAHIQNRLMWGSLAVALATEGLSALLVAGVAPDSDLVYAITTKPMPPNPFYMVAATAWAIFVIMGCLRVTETYPSRFSFPLVATGQLALSLYVAHVVLGMGVLDALRMIGRPNDAIVVYLATGIFYVGAITFAYFWRSHFKRGPLEAVLRRLTV